MGFRSGAFATVWEITNQSEKVTKVRLSTSRKNRNSDEYETDFSGFVSFIGAAHKNISTIEQVLSNNRFCRIRIGDCDVTSRYDKEKAREYVNYAVFSFELADGTQPHDTGGVSGGNKNGAAQNQAQTTKPSNGKQQAMTFVALDDEAIGDIDEDLPF